jgi:hypothetical protein
VLDIDFLKYDELNIDYLEEDKDQWATLLDIDFLDQDLLPDILAQINAELKAQMEKDALKDDNRDANVRYGRDPETGIAVLKDGQMYVWIREGANSRIELRLDDRFGYNMNIRQGDFEIFDYELGEGDNEITIQQAD